VRGSVDRSFDVVLEHLTWYWDRLRVMSLSEAWARARLLVRHHLDAAAFNVAPTLWRRRWMPALERLVDESPREPLGFLTPERATGFRERFAADAASLVARADRAIEGRVRFLGYPEVTLDWAHPLDVDPFSGRVWPGRHGKRIDYRHTDIGDPKWIWELNRCQELPMLVAAWRVSGDPKYAYAARHRMLSWIRAHPPGRGIAWTSGFEAAIRGVSLAVAFDGLRGSDALDRHEHASALQALWQHAQWITFDPAQGTSANNHRIGDLVGLVVLGTLAPELKDSARWVPPACDELCRQVQQQIRPDGTSVEQAFSYHLFVLDLLLVAVGGLMSRGGAIPEPLRDALARAARALWAQLGDDEPEPTYGDSDEGRALILDTEERRTARAIAAGIGAAIGDPSAIRVAGKLDAAAWWLFGASGEDRFSAAPAAPAPETVSLPDAGLTILRRDATRVLVDHGVHGYLKLAAHAHADALAIDVSRGRQRLVVDPGTGSYFARPRLRTAFRGTGFHATVSVDGRSSSDSGGPFLWTRHAQARALTMDLDNASVVCEHNGYAALSDPVTHRRAVLLLADGLVLVVDRLDGEGRHIISQRWPLHPALDLATHEESHIVATHREGGGLLLSPVSTHVFELKAARGELEPPLGWWSSGLESVTPSWLLAVEVEVVGPVEIATLLAPFARETPEIDVRLAQARAAGATVVEIAAADRFEAIEVDLSATPPAVGRRQLAAA
jgi:uncharacterized heparinase superfamily protein